MFLSVTPWTVFSGSPLCQRQSRAPWGLIVKALESARLPGTPLSLDRGSAGQPARSYEELPPESWPRFLVPFPDAGFCKDRWFHGSGSAQLLANPLRNSPQRREQAVSVDARSKNAGPRAGREHGDPERWVCTHSALRQHMDPKVQTWDSVALRSPHGR